MANISSLIAPSGVATTEDLNTGISTADWEAGTSTVKGVVSPADVKSSIDSLASGGFSTRERLDGSGTYTVPEGVTRIRVYIVGGGGQGGGSTNGGSGGSSSFGAFSAGGGAGGGDENGDGGAGGTGGGTGCNGNPGTSGADNTNRLSGSGGGSGGFGGGGRPFAVGVDGGGGGGSSDTAGGGGGGLNIQEIDTSSGSTFSYVSGAGGSSGNGVDGGDGFIIVET